MRIEQDPWIAFKPGEIRDLLIQFGAAGCAGAAGVSVED